MGKLRITVLVEDTAAGERIIAEHGLSVWIESGDRRCLFDTGQGPALLPNASRLGIGLDQTDAVVLSHGHYDHTGGLLHVMNLKQDVTVYAHPAALEPRFARNTDGSSRQIGMPGQVRASLQSSSRLRRVHLPVEVCPGLFLTGPIPRESGFEDTGGPFFIDEQCLVPDELPDDQAVFLDTPGGIVVVLGCAHAGVINTLRYIRELTGNSRIRAVMGGMHLLAAGQERMDRTVTALREMAVQEFFPGHCTGRNAVERLFREFSQRCFPFSAGTILDMEA